MKRELSNCLVNVGGVRGDSSALCLTLERIVECPLVVYLTGCGSETR
jgi:hypothetical protein